MDFGFRDRIPVAATRGQGGSHTDIAIRSSFRTSARDESRAAVFEQQLGLSIHDIEPPVTTGQRRGVEGQRKRTRVMRGAGQGKEWISD
jgi:hypothetical protein